MPDAVTARVVKVFLAIPNMGYTQPAAYDNRLLWAMRMGAESERAKWAGDPLRYEFYLGTVGRLLTPYARDVLAEAALAHGMDLVFMVDDDMLGEPDVFFRLAASVVDGPADICAALAFTRNPDYHPVLYTSLDGRDPVEGPYFRNLPVYRYPKDRLVEVDAVGFGAVVFTTALLRKMTKPWFMNTSPTGEDILFCYQAKRQAGARVFCDTRVKLGHVGTPAVVTEETYETHNGLAVARARDGDEVKYPWEVLR